MRDEWNFKNLHIIFKSVISTHMNIKTNILLVYTDNNCPFSNSAIQFLFLDLEMIVKSLIFFQLMLKDNLYQYSLFISIHLLIY